MINTADTPAELDDFLAHTIRHAAFTLSLIRFSDQSEWSFKDGALSHRSRGFFHVMGLIDAEQQEHLMLYQPQSALTGLAICIKGNQIYVLLQARIEPGNTGIGQYGPTIQSTPANFLSLHGGRSTPCLDLFYDYTAHSKPLSSSMQLDLGCRYFQKSKWHNYVLLSDLSETEPHMIWASMQAICGTLEKDNYHNADLRSLLAVFDWDMLHQTKAVHNDPIGFLLPKLQAGRMAWNYHYQLRPLDELLHWKIVEDGIIPASAKQPQVSVLLYKTSCKTREVSSWVQPLFQAENIGLVVLFIRSRQGIIQCLLSITPEPGISEGYLIAPSLVINPGEASAKQQMIPGNTIVEFTQSDEGGRFYKHENVYRVVEIGQPVGITENQEWIAISELKSLLKMSNVASFQLRCVASVLLQHLHPFLQRQF